MRACRSSTRRAAATAELVGDEAGIGVPHPDGFERDEPPAPEALAEAVARVLADLPTLRRRARGAGRSSGSRSTPWLDRHAEIFASASRRA